MTAQTSTARFIGCVVAATLLFIIVFTMLADPFGFAGWPLPDSVPRPGREDRDRFVKPWDILIQKPDTILFGTSRVKQGFNPEHAPAIFGRVYNAAIDDGLPADMHSLFTFAVEHDSNLKTAIFELFFYTFFSQTSSLDFVPHGLRYITDPMCAYLSPIAMGLSFRTWYDFARGRIIPLTTKRNGFVFRPFPPANGPFFVRGYAIAEKDLPDTLRRGFAFDTFAEFSEIRMTCEKKGIRCIFFASPLGAFLLSCLERSNLWDSYVRWLELLARDNSVADFSGLAFENLDGPMPHWANTEHFTDKTGYEILGALASNSYSRLEATTVAAKAELLRDRVLDWTKNNIALAPDESCPK